MRRFRILTLMVLIFALAVAIAALRNADDLWAGGLMLVTPLVLCIALVGASCGRKSRRAGRLGFAIFGGAYFALAFLGLSESNLALLPTSKLLKLAHNRVTPGTYLVYFTAMQTGKTGATTTESFTLARPAMKTTQVPKVARSGLDATAVTRAWRTTLDPADGSLRWRAILPGAANLAAFSAVGHCLFALLAGLLGSAVALRFRPREDEASGRGRGAGIDVLGPFQAPAG